ncbi:hypothetical protein HCH_00710 [Hahella chejuensis KCTC 2396]|uniref:Lipoprotein n=1 Tax=Hahella chejuensis (strain KCTC 2396) TaxID=349521 RepID=Q2SP16_HAHCH|nr:hypothetical protein [Hahella chejuensis]ABC27608.1 hypothetical protein HCH_00710 [Hahella chejuensis KCTC 2396]
MKKLLTAATFVVLGATPWLGGCDDAQFRLGVNSGCNDPAPLSGDIAGVENGATVLLKSGHSALTEANRMSEQFSIEVAAIDVDGGSFFIYTSSSTLGSLRCEGVVASIRIS